MDKVIVCVHGRDEQWDLCQTLLEDFQNSILESLGRLSGPVALTREQIELAFYGDLFLPDAPIQAQATDTAPDPTFQVNVARMLIRGAVERQLIHESILKQIPGYRVEGISWFHPFTTFILETLNEIVGAPRDVLRFFVSDVDHYLHNANLRQQVMGRLLTVLEQQAGKEIILIGFSLGSVIAYDVLSTHPELSVNSFVTLGSPLGLSPFIYNELLPHLPTSQKHSFPDTIKRTWNNFYDHNDIVALVPGLAPLFPSPSGKIISSCAVQNNPEDPHSQSGYLLQLAVGRVIEQALGVTQPAYQQPGRL